MLAPRHKSRHNSPVPNVPVPLPTVIHAQLKAEAKRSRQLTTALAIEAWLVEREKEALRDAIADYAHALAGTPADLDRDMESAAVEHLLNGERDDT